MRFSIKSSKNSKEKFGDGGEGAPLGPFPRGAVL